MATIKTVLFPTALTDISPEVVTWVRNLVESLKARLIVLYVAPTLASGMGTSAAGPTAVDHDRKHFEFAQQKLAELAETHLRGLDYELEIVGGEPDPEDGIVRLAEEKGADLIAMGTHARKGLNRLLVGSVARQVVQKSAVPVLTINPSRLKT